MCPEPVPDVRVAPYWASSCRATPLLQPKPSCVAEQGEALLVSRRGTTETLLNRPTSTHTNSRRVGLLSTLTCTLYSPPAPGSPSLRTSYWNRASESCYCCRARCLAASRTRSLTFSNMALCFVYASQLLLTHR